MIPFGLWEYFLFHILSNHWYYYILGQFYFWLSVEEIGLSSCGFNVYFPISLKYLFICLWIIYPYLWNAIQLSSAYFYWVAFLFLNDLKDLLIYCGCSLCQLRELQNTLSLSEKKNASFCMGTKEVNESGITGSQRHVFFLFQYILLSWPQNVCRDFSSPSSHYHWHLILSGFKILSIWYIGEECSLIDCNLKFSDY